MSDIKVSSMYSPGIPSEPATNMTPVTPHHQIRTPGSLYTNMSDRSPADIKHKLELRLADTKTKMYNIGKLGESLVKQERELCERISEMEAQSLDDEIRPELRSKLADLENGFKEVERESAKAFSKTVPFLGKENMGLPRTPGMESPTKSEFVGNGTVSPSKNQIGSRKARNGTPRQHDIEFAADIGQGLLEEVRKLQAMVAQRDQKLSEAATSISRSDRQIELFDRKVKQMHEDQELLKEENWNMHLRNQELQNQFTTAAADASKYGTENTRLLAQTTSLTTAVETLKLKNAELSANLADAKTKQESEISSLRRSQTSLQRDRSDLQRHVDELKLELMNRPEPSLEDINEQIDPDNLSDGEESVTPIDRSPAASPQLSPIKNTPSRNAPLELETTKSSLHHAHRMVTNLRNTLHREKTEKLELRRLLATAQDEVEQLRNKPGSKRGPKRQPSKRPMVDMLGNRKVRHEVSFEDDPQVLDINWREDDPSSAAYHTANEESDAFVTATEHEMDETDTDYRTGAESQLNSDDDGDETETEAHSTRRIPDLGVIRDISPAMGFTSDEDDSPVRPLVGLKHRRSAINGRRVDSSSYDPPPQPLFKELMQGGSIASSPMSGFESPTSSVGTAMPASPMLLQRDDLEEQEIEMVDIGCQCDPIPDPEPIVIQLPPVTVYDDRVVTVYKERELPPCVEVGTQSDPVPPPEPIIIQSEPIIIPAEPAIVYVERERPAHSETAVQSEPLPAPEPVVVYKEKDKPVSAEIAVQSDPWAEPKPIVIQADPVVVYRDREVPLSAETGVQSDDVTPDVVYIERETPVTNEVGIQAEHIVPEVKELGIQSDEPEVVAPRIESLEKEIQTLLSIPLMETYQFDGRSLSSAATRPVTPNMAPLAITSLITPSKSITTTSDTVTPKTTKSVSIDWENTPKSPLKEITNARQSPTASVSRSSMRYPDSPSTFSSRIGTTRRYGTLTDHPTLHPSPRATLNRSRMSQPISPSKMDQKRQMTMSPQSRMSRSTTAMSHRTSISSFESEVEDRFGLSRDEDDGIKDGQYATSTNPQIIQAITQTMIGDYLYKYTRKMGLGERTELSDKRHRRFFWIHPYTKTLYWSTDNPATSKDSTRNTRSAPISRIEVTSDENPFPPGLCRKSIICFAKNRAIKFTAPTRHSHEIWLQALNHLLDMGPMMADIQDAETESRPSTTDRSFDMREFGAMATKNGTARMASMSTIATSSQSDVKHGSLGRIQAIFRPERGTMSTIKGKSPVRSIYEASMVTDSSRQSHEHICDADDEGLENVRACCGGKHDVGTLSKKGKHTHK